MSDVIVKTENSNDKEDIHTYSCRDFSRGTCDRQNCKFKHVQTKLSFCHDFQNNFCTRPKCKFIHCPADDEEVYKRTGQMSSLVLAEATRKNQPGMIPICIRFQKGACRRNNCKFRHLTKEEEEIEILGLVDNKTPINQITNYEIQPLPVSSCGVHRIGQVLTIPNDFGSCDPPLPKRRLLNDDSLDTDRNEHVFKGYCAGTPPAPILNSADARTIMLEEEVSVLHQEINKLKRQVQDLTATNEFLLDQNATLRVSNKHNGAVASNALSNTTPATSQQVIRTVTANVANVPVSLATVPVSLATVPVSLTTVTNCNPVSISAVPSVSIASPAQLLAPSQQILVTTNPSNQLAIAASNAQQLAMTGQQLTLTSQNQQQLALASQQNQQQLALATQNQQQLALATQNQQQLALATQNQQQLALASQNQQQLALASHQNQQQLALASQNQQQLALANQQNQQQLALATQNQQQLALASQQNQQQLALASQNQQQLALANQQNQQQLALATQNQQLLAQQNLATPQQIELHRSIQTSQPIATQAMVSYPIVTHTINHGIH